MYPCRNSNDFYQRFLQHLENIEQMTDRKSSDLEIHDLFNFFSFTLCYQLYYFLLNI